MLKVNKLRCEYLKNPTGIGDKNPRLSWVLDSDGKGILQVSYKIQISKDDESFKNIFWDSGIIRSEDSVNVSCKGLKLSSRSRYYYRVRVTDNKKNESPWSKTAYFETGIFDEKEWKADFITADAEEKSEYSSAAPLFRKEFKCKGEIRSARIYATSLGMYELRLNGERVGDYQLTPGWTSYSKRLQYQTYDVTDMVKTGVNAIGGMVGSGWYRGYLGWGDGMKSNRFGKRSALFVQMHISYADGREQVVVTDETWKCTPGPILMSEIYHGETYDARMDASGWDKPGFEDSAWSPVYTIEVEKKTLIAQEGLPVRKIETIKPVEIIKTPKGETVVNIGQNIAGWLKFKVKGPKGSRVVLKHGQILDEQGNFYTLNNNGARQTIEYTLKGEGEECFEPHFTYLGFQYILLEEYPGEPRVEDFTGIAIHSDMEPAGRFSSSNELLNKLWSNILWTQKSNYVDVPTDCPNRDEKCGWTDANFFLRTCSFNMNVYPFYKKWLRDLKADQLEDGGIPYCIPGIELPLPFNSSSSGWSDSAVIVPWYIYQIYGDIRVLEEQYESMKKWVEYIYNHSENGLIWNTGFHFGDWLALDVKIEGQSTGETDIDYLSTVFYSFSTNLLYKTAKLLKKDADAKKYKQLYNKIIRAFQREFVSPEGRLCVKTQTAYVQALMFNMIQKKHIKRTIDTLVDFLKNNNWHFTTGYLGTPYLCYVLCKYGYPEVAYKLLLQTEFPSWLFEVIMGATTVWERMNSIKADGTLFDPAQNTLNQGNFASIGEWLYKGICGIDTSEKKPGYKHIILKPVIGRELQWAEAEYESMYGLIRLKWNVSDNKMKLDITIPHNTKASILLPFAKIAILKEGGVSVKNQTLYSKISETEKGVTLQLGSGSYSFSYPFDINVLQIIDK